MKVGYALRDITPQKPCPMSGFDLRQEEWSSIHDPLAVRALAICENAEESAGNSDENIIGNVDGKQNDAAKRIAGEKETRKVVIACDLLGVSMLFTDMVRQRMQEKLGLGKDRVQVSGIHTHAAPKSIFASFTCYDPEYLSWIADMAVEAADEALCTAELAKAELIAGTVNDVASYRDGDRESSRFAMPCDVICFTFAKANPVLLLTYHAHPTVMNEKNLMISRDLVYGCDKALKEAIPGVRTIFLNGACGDVSTRYTRRSSDFEEVDRLGGLWAAKVVSMLKDADGAAKPEDGEKKYFSASVSKTLFVPPARFFTMEERGEILKYLDQKIETCQDPEQKREYISCRSVLVREHYGTKTEGEDVWISIMTIGPGLLVFIPFEYSQRQALDLKEKVTEKLKTLDGGESMTVEIVGYSNGYEGYLPSGRPLDKDSGYMDMGSVFHSGAADLLADKVLEMMDLSDVEG